MKEYKVGMNFMLEGHKFTISSVVDGYVNAIDYRQPGFNVFAISPEYFKLNCVLLPKLEEVKPVKKEYTDLMAGFKSCYNPDLVSQLLYDNNTIRIFKDSWRATYDSGWSRYDYCVKCDVKLDGDK